MTDRKTLIILTPGFPKDEADSTCLPFLQHLVKAINRNFPQPELVILSFQYPFFNSTYTWKGNTVIAFGGSNKNKFYRRWLWLRVKQELEKLDRNKQIAGIFSLWLDECAFVGNKFAKKHKIKHYTWLLGQDAREGNRYIKKINPSADQLAATSDFIADEFYKNYEIRPKTIIPNAIDPSLFTAKDHIRDIDILGAGSLIPLKQYDIFIEVVHQLKQQFPGIRSVICGKGPEEGRLKEMIVHFNLQDNIELKDELPQEEVIRLMQRTRLFLHPSSYEGFSGVCLEALASGAQVISFTKAMDHPVPHWHITTNKKEMIHEAARILNDKEADHSPVTPFLIDDTAKAVLNLFM